MIPTVDVDLVRPDWRSHGATRAIGHAHVDDRFHGSGDLARVFDACPTDEHWRRLLARCNGSFAIISQREDSVLAAVDRVRSFPLFYRAAGRARISDRAERLLDEADGHRFNTPAGAEFRLTGYVTGRETLLREVFQLRAGELVQWDAECLGEPRKHSYYRFEHGDYFTTDAEDLVDRLGRVHDRVFGRLVESTAGRQIVVPLSGGHDSRLIAVSLRDLGARDVVCYSYGLQDNWEARISQELAQYLGFRWEFVPYTPERWREWAATETFARYFREAGNHVSVPHIQDWPAVQELTRDGKVAADSVFVPGHSGDFLAGSHIPPDFVASPMVRRSAFLDALLRAHYSLWDWPREGRTRLRQVFAERIEAVVGRVGDVSSARAADLFELWDLEERQAKFICNSVRVYEHFGHAWRLPLFDHELMDFWARVPVQLRVGRKLYFKFARDRQQLPVTAANTDRNVVMDGMVRGITAVGMKPLAKRVRRIYRTWRWRDEYAAGSLGWLAIVDEDYFRQTYTGKELLHSYLAVAYRNWAQAHAEKVRAVIPGLAA